MNLSLTVCAEDISQEKAWVDQLKVVLKSFGEIQIHPFKESKDFGQAVFVDGSMNQLDRFIEKMDRRGRALFLILNEMSSLPKLWQEGRVDDVVVAPFRAIEVLSKLRHYEQILMWNEVVELNASISSLLQKLQEDLKLTERLQKVRLPQRFPSVKGFKVASRYFAGVKPGGDYFDLAESQDKAHLSLILTHSTSYGLSNAVLTALLRVTLKLTLDRLGSDGATSEIVRRIYDELVLTLGEKDQLSLFYGTINRQDRVLRFVNLGNALIFYAQPGGRFEKLPMQGKAISKASLTFDAETKIQLGTDGRLILLSFGFVKALGGDSKILEILDLFREKEAADLLNELAFKMKSNLPNDEEMPSQDCSALILDVDSQVLRLTRREQDEN